MAFNGTPATTIGSWSATSIVATVPTGATSGNVVVSASVGTSNGVSFTVVAPPSITSLSPTTGAGRVVSIDYWYQLRLDSGLEFGGIQRNAGNDD